MTEHPEDVLQAAREAAADTVHHGHAHILKPVYLAGDRDDHAVRAAWHALMVDRARHLAVGRLPRATIADVKEGWTLSSSLLAEVSRIVQEKFRGSPSWDEIELIMLETERRMNSTLILGSLEGGVDEDQ